MGQEIEGGERSEERGVQVRHDHDVELLGPGDKLHGGVVDAARYQLRREK